jgi:hypothetical protein
MTELEQLCAKVKAIAQGPNADLLKKFIDLLYQEHEPEYFSPEDLAAIEEGMKASREGDRSQFVPWEDIKKELDL